MRKRACLCCDSPIRSRCMETASQTWLYLRINTWDIGQVYLGSHKIKAELATVITAIIEGLIQGSNVQEMGAKLLFMQKA